MERGVGVGRTVGGNQQLCSLIERGADRGELDLHRPLAEAALCRRGGGRGGLLPAQGLGGAAGAGMGLFRPHIDGILLTESFDDAARKQHLADASYMIGCTLDDIRPMGTQIDEFCFLRDSLDHRPAFQYLFARKLPGTHDGAFHSAELWYMFHTLNRSWRPMMPADYVLADEVMDCWTNFAKYGNPNGKSGSETNWRPFTLANPYVKIFNVKFDN